MGQALAQEKRKTIGEAEYQKRNQAVFIATSMAFRSSVVTKDRKAEIEYLEEAKREMKALLQDVAATAAEWGERESKLKEQLNQTSAKLEKMKG